MAKLKTNHAGGVAVPERKPRRAMPAIIRNVPPGHKWGWYSEEEPRMHLQSVDGQHNYKVWLENKGKRILEPTGKIPAKVLKALREQLGDIQTRKFVETNWARLMIAKRWVAMYIVMPKITLAAYPNTPNKFTRVIDLTEWFNEKQLATLSPEIIELNQEMGSLRLWTNRPEEQTYDARLSTLLWGEYEARTS